MVWSDFNKNYFSASVCPFFTSSISIYFCSFYSLVRHLRISHDKNIFSSCRVGKITSTTPQLLIIPSRLSTPLVRMLKRLFVTCLVNMSSPWHPCPFNWAVSPSAIQPYILYMSPQLTRCRTRRFLIWKALTFLLWCNQMGLPWSLALNN